jgi:hypothetical protein
VLIVGCFITLSAAALSFAITSFGVFAGANIPYHAYDSKPGIPASANVGTSG